MLDATLVVPFWILSEKRLELAERTSELFRCSDCEVILIDNGSPFPLDGADIVLEENIGYPAAVNLGLKQANGAHLAVGSMDIVVPDGWVEPMIQGETVTSPVPKTNDKPGFRGPHYGPLWMMPRSVLDTVGFLDEEWPFYADRDLAIRMAQAGYEFARVPEVVVEHVDSGKSWTHEHKVQEGDRFAAKHGYKGFGPWLRANR